jgi:hypothetical protein
MSQHAASPPKERSQPRAQRRTGERSASAGPIAYRGEARARLGLHAPAGEGAESPRLRPASPSALAVQRLFAGGATGAAGGGAATGSDRKRCVVGRIERIQAAQRAMDGEQAVALAREGTSDAGEPLPLLRELQAAFGPHDLSTVRLHRGPAAEQAASSLSAAAFAHGEHIALAGPPTLRTLAHEAAHVVQQRQGGQPAGLSQPGDASEQAADAVADAVTRGDSAAGLLGPGGSSGQATTDSVQRLVSEEAVEAQLKQRSASGGTKQALQGFLHECLSEEDVDADSALVIMHWFIKHSDEKLISDLGGIEEVYGAVWKSVFAYDDELDDLQYLELSHDVDKDFLEDLEPNQDYEQSLGYEKENEDHDPIVPVLDDDQGMKADDPDLAHDSAHRLSVILEQDEDQEPDADVPQLLRQANVDSLAPDSDSADEVIEEKQPKTPKMDTIDRCISVIHKAYVACDAKAMMSEKLVYAFTEDLDYMTEVVQSFRQAGPQADKSEEKQASEEKGAELPQPTKAEQAHRKSEAKRYRQRFKDPKDAEAELQLADEYVNVSVIATANNYRNRERLAGLLDEVRKLRVQYPKSGLFDSKAYPISKDAPRQMARRMAELALKILESTEENYKYIRLRKSELIKQKRIAAEFSENPKLWSEANLKPKLRNKVYDFGYGMISAGLWQVKDESDFRGFILPAESTRLDIELRESYKKIRIEYQLLQSLKGKGPGQLFTAINSVIQLMQIFDRAVLSGAKRVIRHLKYYMTALAAVPVAAPIAAALSAVLSALSGGISLLQSALNGLVVALRSVQIWQGNATVENLLLFSRRNAAIHGFFATSKVLMESAQDPDMDSVMDYGANLRDNATVSGLRAAPDASADNSSAESKESAIEEFGINTAPDWVLKLMKEGVKEYGKAKINYVKAYGPRVKGNLSGSMAEDKEHMDPEAQALFTRGLRRLDTVRARFVGDAGKAGQDLAESAEDLSQAPALVEEKLKQPSVESDPANDRKQVALAQAETEQTATVLRAFKGSTKTAQDAVAL